VPALLMFAFAGFVIGGIGQEFWRGARARRAVSGEPVPLALVSLVRRNRRRYGGYIAHVGISVLFVGVAASSSFKDVRDVALEPGQSATVGGYEFTYVAPVAELHAASNGRLERIALGARLSVRKEGGEARPLRTSKDYFPSQDPSLGPVSRFFDGESTTEVGLDASLRNDVWAAVAPDIVKLRPRIEEGDRLFERARDDLTLEQSNEFLALALRGLTDRYAESPPPARFRLEVNPLVTWIWLGALIVVIGGVIAGWPSSRGAGGAAGARYAARVGRDVRDARDAPRERVPV
jgi:cytochrome c-type biogenesis protein CcmF